MEVATFRWLHSGGYIKVATLRWLHGGGYIEVATWIILIHFKVFMLEVIQVIAIYP
jgi:hypothetical protein